MATFVLSTDQHRIDDTKDCELSSDILEQNLQDHHDEILALNSIFADTDRVRILTEPKSSGDGETTAEGEVYSLQLDVVVDVGSDGLTVEAWRPCEDSDGERQESTDTNHETGVEGAAQPRNLNAKPQYHRTLSGRRWYASFHVSHLTPLCLELVMPKSYPSQSPPLFNMSCLWLDVAQISVLCRELDKLWTDNCGMPVIYVWVDWLRTNTLSNLCLEKKIQLIHDSADTDSTGVDPRAITENVTLDESLAKLHRFNYEENNRIFSHSQQLCGICFEVKFGHEFFRLSVCQHHFCAECMKSYCTMHVKEGTVQQLTCPDPKCSTEMPSGILQAVLDEADYERWERLVLQNTVDLMGDIVWCPRCNSPVVRDKEQALQLAHCLNCLYAFCTKCHESWHQQRPCADEELPDENKQKSSTKKQVLSNRMSTRWVREFTKPCPKCSAPIQKDGGCNKLTCMKCYTEICWICGKQLSGYEHFGTCPLWSDEYTVPRRQRPVPEGAMKVQQHLQENRHAGQQLIIACPNCRQKNLKEKRNNHIRCFACKKNFCFLCTQVINPPIMMHYRVGAPCVQHSD